jgi:hypothetical protein
VICLLSMRKSTSKVGMQFHSMVRSKDQRPTVQETSLEEPTVDRPIPQ